MKTQEERLNYLIEKFKEESLEYKNLETPAEVEDKKVLLVISNDDNIAAKSLPT